MALPTLDWLRNKELVLVTVSVFQPTDKQTLFGHLSSKIDAQTLDEVLDDLVDEKMVVCENGYFRTTLRGERSLVPRRGVAMRDTQRLLHLVQLSKGGEAKLGDDSLPLV